MSQQAELSSRYIAAYAESQKVQGLLATMEQELAGVRETLQRVKIEKTESLATAEKSANDLRGLLEVTKRELDTARKLNRQLEKQVKDQKKELDRLKAAKEGDSLFVSSMPSSPNPATPNKARPAATTVPRSPATRSARVPPVAPKTGAKPEYLIGRKSDGVPHIMTNMASAELTSPVMPSRDLSSALGGLRSGSASPGGPFVGHDTLPLPIAAPPKPAEHEVLNRTFDPFGMAPFDDLPSTASSPLLEYGMLNDATGGFRGEGQRAALALNASQRQGPATNAPPGGPPGLERAKGIQHAFLSSPPPPPGITAATASSSSAYPRRNRQQSDIVPPDATFASSPFGFNSFERGSAGAQVTVSSQQQTPQPPLQQPSSSAVQQRVANAFQPASKAGPIGSAPLRYTTNSK